VTEDEYLIRLMAKLQTGEVDIFDFSFSISPPDNDAAIHCRFWAERLIKEKLAVYTDDQRTTLRLTNYGRYWQLKGGYEAFLRDAHLRRERKNIDRSKRESILKEKEELVESRLKLTHFRIVGFWISLIVALTGFLVSVFNLFTLLKK
jgi:hypothetical protein